MGSQRVHIMKKGKLLILCVISELSVIILVAGANIFEGTMFYVFYNLLYGLGVSITVPLVIMLRQGTGLGGAGLRRLGRRQVFVLPAFVLFSVAGQLLPKLAAGERPDFTVLPAAVLPLVMTTFFEEFLFRGLFQSNLEKAFGAIPAVIISGLMFSLYHLGYPGFRAAGDILLLFAVGTGFALSFFLSGGNLTVSFFVNLPNAFVTYVLKQGQFPVMTAVSSVYACITILLAAAVLFIFEKKLLPARSGVRGDN